MLRRDRERLVAMRPVATRDLDEALVRAPPPPPVSLDLECLGVWARGLEKNARLVGFPAFVVEDSGRTADARGVGTCSRALGDAMSLSLSVLLRCEGGGLDPPPRVASTPPRPAAGEAPRDTRVDRAGLHALDELCPGVPARRVVFIREELAAVDCAKRGRGGASTGGGAGSVCASALC